MGREYRHSFKIYSAWNYEKEVEDLNRASEEGWQLVRGYGLHSKFVKNPDVRYRYQLDYGKIDDIGRYIETFREQGWEYVNSTFNGWHYFRKLYDPSLPEEAYEIFTDRESMLEMNRRWVRLALVISIIIGILAVFYLIQVIRAPKLPAIVLFATLAVECVVLLRGVGIMRNAAASRSRKGDSLFVTLFFAVIIIGALSSVALTVTRPTTTTDMRAGDVDEPVIDSRFGAVTVRYPDNYYLDLDLKAPSPITFEVIDENGEAVYSRTETEFHGEDISIRLSGGEYCFSMSCESGYHLKLRLD